MKKQNKDTDPIPPKGVFQCPLSRRDAIKGLGAGISLVALGCSADSNSNSEKEKEKEEEEEEGNDDTGTTTSETDTGTDEEKPKDTQSETDDSETESPNDTGTGTGNGNGNEDDTETDDTETDDTETDDTETDDTETEDNGKSKIYIASGTNRETVLAELMTMVDMSFADGKDIVMKPNYNSSNAFPASTHNDTISGVVDALRDAGCDDITLAESSGPKGYGKASGVSTADVTADLGTENFCNSLGIDFLCFDDMDSDGWEDFSFSGMQWPGNEMTIPKIMRSDHAVVLLPCLKTHVWGQFTLSLKLAVGLLPFDDRWDILHPNAGGSREYIAEINKGFEPDLIVLDGISAFRTGGPNDGEVVHPGLMFAGTDRVAMDAVGVAVLKMHNAENVSGKSIYGQDQIKRAVELGLGAASPDDIELIGDDDSIIAQIRAMLDEG